MREIGRQGGSSTIILRIIWRAASNKERRLFWRWVSLGAIALL
jgi:hypothetical protein